ncbi:MAG TPA: DUF3866 family protein [Armatimonadota bacterium]|nr:DUF3866 family protein [Armatimonadota bacterium]
MLKAEVGVVLSIEASRAGAQEAVIEVAGKRARALNYPRLTGPIAGGERVLLNTTAVRLGLGTGGLHFVMKRLDDRDNATPPATPDEPGHVIKLRYTPLQFSCLSAEEADSPHHEALRTASSLNGAPVVACSLHSMIAPAAAGVKALLPAARVVYVMTDAAALPIAVSRLVAQLQEAGLLDTTVTCGQAFGGAYEAVNLFSGLLTARLVGEADVIIAGQGPGNVGTGTLYGFGGIEQGEIINATAVLGGRPVAAVRISFADPRERHRGVSHHSLVALGRVALARAAVVLPQISDDRARQVGEKLAAADIPDRHDIVTASGEAGLAELARRGVAVKSMGRAVDDDPEFFLAAAAAGEYAASRCAGSEPAEG